jgi:hypothetical protein
MIPGEHSSVGPQQIGDDQAHTEDCRGTAHPANLCGHNGQHEDCPDDAITRRDRVYLTRHSASSQLDASALPSLLEYWGCRVPP